MSLNDSLIFRWNTDEDGRPCSWFIPNEMQQVSTTHNTIQLIQVPDQLHRVRIIKEDGTELTEVFNIDEINYDCFYVNYSIGIVQLHKSLQGQTVWSTYYGKGIVLISDARIFHSVGGSAVDTWDNILERSKDALNLVESAGGLANAMIEIEDKIDRGHETADRIQSLVDEVALYGYTIDLTRQSFAVKANEIGEVKKSEISTVYCDVVAYKGNKPITPTLSITTMEQCTIEIVGQRIKLKTIETDCLQARASINVILEEGVSTQKEIVISKIFDGVSQYTVDMSNAFYSFEADSAGRIEKEQSITCEVKVVKANLEYDNFSIVVQNKPNGLKCVVNGQSVVFTAMAGANLASSGNCSVVVMVDGATYNKMFSWNKVKRGENAKSLIVTGNQILKYSSSDYTGIPTPHQSILTATAQGLIGTPIWYYKNGDEWEVIQNQTELQLTITHSHPLIWGDRKETTIKCELDGFSDEISLVKLTDGSDGNDSISVILTNESHTVSIGNDGEISEYEISKVRTKVKAFKGLNEVACTLSKGTLDGCDIDFNEQEVYLTHIENSPLTAVAHIIVNVEGITIEKALTISKALQGQNGNDGTTNTYVLNITGGTRSVTYSQINLDPRPSVSTSFYGTLYKNGEELIDGVSYYWVAQGHVLGTSISNIFTPEISTTFDETINNNEITLTVTHDGNTLIQTVPIAITKDANGLDWVQEWDSTKVDIRDNVVLTPKLFAGQYDQENDLISGVAMGSDMINNGESIGIAGYQNNEVTFMLDTDGTLMVGNPFIDGKTGMFFDGNQFILKVNEMSIEGKQVAKEDDVQDYINGVINEMLTEVEQGFLNLDTQLSDLEIFMSEGLQDKMLDDVERAKLEAQFSSLKIDYVKVTQQYTSLSGNASLEGTAIKMTLLESYETYVVAFNELEAIFNEILVTEEIIEQTQIDTFNQKLSAFSQASNTLNTVMQDAMLGVSKIEANKIVDEAKKEIMSEVDDVNNAIADLESTMNGSFKTGLISQATIQAIQQRVSAIETELSDIKGKYNSMMASDKLSTTSKTALTTAKNELDLAFEELKGVINTSIPDYLLTEEEIKKINDKTSILNTKLTNYSTIAQNCNSEIALNLAQGVVDAISDEEVFNKVTSHGVKQGLFIDDGKLYINGQYVKTRNLIAQTDDGTETFKIDNQGNVHLKVKSFSLVSNATTNIPTKDEVSDMIDNADVKDVLKVEVYSSNGLSFRNGNVYTTLSATLYSSKKDVTDQYTDSQFIWTRQSDYPEQDRAWNSQHSTGQKSIEITRNDMLGRATFTCTVYDQLGRALTK